MNISLKEFENLVQEVIENLPEAYFKKLHNVAFLVRDYPDQEQTKKLNMGRGYVLFGLYEGYYQSSRKNLGPVLPDKITIFRKAILSQCQTKEEIKDKIKKVIKHEIAHHFGSGEQGADKAERRLDI